VNLLDENFPDDQRQILARWRLPHRQVGREAAWFGAQDSDLVPLFHRLRWVTFFTLDEDFFKRSLCHGAYCLVWLDVPSDDAAEYLRRFLRHPRFRAHSHRLGVVARVHHGGIAFWEFGLAALQRVAWQDA
jgi:hypothetical protein